MASMAADPSSLVGARVRAHGLKSDTSLNGLMGTVMEALPNGRVVVAFDDSDVADRSIRPGNLM